MHMSNVCGRANSSYVLVVLLLLPGPAGLSKTNRPGRDGIASYRSSIFIKCDGGSRIGSLALIFVTYIHVHRVLVGDQGRGT
jgi:hypothetical protein